MPQSTEDKKSKNLLWQYAGFATQLLLAIGASVFVGYEADKILKPPIPLLVWVVPLLLIIFTLIKVVRDTSKKK